MPKSLAPTDTVSTPRPGIGIGPHTILKDVIGSLYHSFNAMAMNFGFTIPQALVFIGGLVVVLMIWSIIGGLRNRKSFSLVDEPEPEQAE